MIRGSADSEQQTQICQLPTGHPILLPETASVWARVDSDACSRDGCSKRVRWKRRKAVVRRGLGRGVLWRRRWFCKAYACVEVRNALTWHTQIVWLPDSASTFPLSYSRLWAALCKRDTSYIAPCLCSSLYNIANYFKSQAR